MAGPINIRYTGIDDLITSLKLTDVELLADLEEAMRSIGDVVRDDARQRFTTHFSIRTNAKSALSVEHTADNFETRLRGFTIGNTVSVFVGQRLRSVTGKRGDWGGEMMRFGLVPARDEKINQAAALLEETVFGTLQRHGF